MTKNFAASSTATAATDSNGFRVTRMPLILVLRKLADLGVASESTVVWLSSDDQIGDATRQTHLVWELISVGLTGEPGELCCRDGRVGAMLLQFPEI